MREILFRGKRIDHCEWAYGDLINNYDGRKFVGEVVVDDYKGTANDTYEVGIGFVEVDPSTVGMCVPGITDKNGERIFEGDILFCTREIGMGYREFRGKVVYKAPKFYVDCGNVVLSLDCNNGKPDFIIIGNIYDNPELLEVKK